MTFLSIFSFSNQRRLRIHITQSYKYDKSKDIIYEHKNKRH